MPRQPLQVNRLKKQDGCQKHMRCIQWLPKQRKSVDLLAGDICGTHLGFSSVSLPTVHVLLMQPNSGAT
jgi:hexokinase